jgi:hypothetical protein
MSSCRTAISYIINRINSYPLSTDSKNRGQHNKTVLQNNKYPYTLQILSDSIQNRPSQIAPKRREIITYSGKQVRNITNLFQNAGVQITFRTNNNAGQHKHL